MEQMLSSQNYVGWLGICTVSTTCLQPTLWLLVPGRIFSTPKYGETYLCGYLFEGDQKFLFRHVLSRYSIVTSFRLGLARAFTVIVKESHFSLKCQIGLPRRHGEKGSYQKPQLYTDHKHNIPVYRTKSSNPTPSSGSW